MNKKQIKTFYLSLIDNPEARWQKEKVFNDNKDWILYHCRVGNIEVKSYPGFKIGFKYMGSENSWRNTSEIITFKDIGISLLHLLFPYFGVASRIERRIKRELKQSNSNYTNSKIENISNVLKKDKALFKQFNRDSKIDEILK